MPTDKKTRKPSGLDQFLRESLAHDPEFRSNYLAEARRLPVSSRRRALRRLLQSHIGHDRY